MQRIPEPELMLDAEQAEAYAAADFEDAHSNIINHFTRLYPVHQLTGPAIDLGCGPADIAVRLAGICPDCHIDAVDGSATMLEHARKRLLEEGLERRIHLIHSVLSELRVDSNSYTTIISNSLLHHLHEPLDLWRLIQRIAAKNALIYISDLMRPQTREEATVMVEAHMGDAPPVLRRDFYNSLLAAFSLDEIRAQLLDSGLHRLIAAPISDRHLVIHGRLQ